jgi:hypothetical protein
VQKLADPRSWRHPKLEEIGSSDQGRWNLAGRICCTAFENHMAPNRFDHYFNLWSRKAEPRHDLSAISAETVRTERCHLEVKPSFNNTLDAKLDADTDRLLEEQIHVLWCPVPEIT